MKLLRYGAVFLFLMSLWGCGKGNGSAPAAAAIDPATGKHPAGMAVAVTGGSHVDAYFASASGFCAGCHGLPSDITGGQVKVSCSTASRSGMACHAGKWPHGTGYAAFNLHGNAAKSGATAVSGMASCKKCHGADYKGIANLGVNCVSCHNGADGSNAPHAANWVTGANSNSVKHSSADPTNAAACAQCHLGGTFSHAASSPAPAGTAPGCFNGTMCHNSAGHAPYTAVTHQPDARANVTCGLTCHATPATGTSNPRFNVSITTTNGTPMGSGCETCHNRPGLAHPYIWLPNRPVSTGTTTHGNNGTTGIPGNVLSACGTCHNVTVAGAKFGVPSCLSGAAGVAGISCHFTSPVNGASQTLGCASCHNTPPDGIALPNRDNKHSAHVSNIPSLACSACHTGYGPPTATHANGVANALINGIFDDGGATYTAGVGCTNISCHGGKATPAWNTTANLNYVYDATSANCTSNCHTVVDTNGNGAGQYINVYNGDYINIYYGAPTTANLNLHAYHSLVLGAQCGDCHGITDPTKLPAVHFTQLFNGKRQLGGTVQGKGFAAGSIGGTGTQITSYTVTPSGCLATLGCHGDGVARPWFQ